MWGYPIRIWVFLRRADSVNGHWNEGDGDLKCGHGFKTQPMMRTDPPWTYSCTWMNLLLVNFAHSQIEAPTQVSRSNSTALA